MGRVIVSSELQKPLPSGKDRRTSALPHENGIGSKSEARNTNSETILKDRNINDPNGISLWHLVNDSVFVIGTFDIGICFEFRDSNFEFCQYRNGKSCPLGLDQGRVLWTRIFTF